MTTKVVACCDNFKGTATAVQVHAAIAAGLGDAAAVDSVPMTDGGAGFLTALLAARSGDEALHVVEVPNVTGPLGTPIESARYAFDTADTTAYIEMAASSGIELVDPAHLDPLTATTRGFGELIAHAVALGASRICIGLGGSATNDGGMGMLEALGLVVESSRSAKSHPHACGATLLGLRRIAGADAVRHALRGRSGEPVALELVTDVTNPLCGSAGATAVYGPQKGVTAEMRDPLDAAMAAYGRMLSDLFGVEAVAEQPGAGAAGGSGAALIALGGAVTPGAPRFASIVRLEERMMEADVVVTGEGSFDSQTLAYGKTVAVVAQCAAKASAKREPLGKPPLKVVVLCGRCVDVSADEIRDAGVHQVISLTPTFPAEKAMTQTTECIRDAVAASGLAQN